LDRAAILGDAIKYVQELKKEQDDLRIELERNSEDEGADHNNIANHHHQHHLHQGNFSSEVSNPLGGGFAPDYDHEKLTNGFHMGASESLKRNLQEYESTNDKAQQMEVLKCLKSPYINHRLIYIVFCRMISYIQSRS